MSAILDMLGGLSRVELDRGGPLSDVEIDQGCPLSDAERGPNEDYPQVVQFKLPNGETVNIAASAPNNLVAMTKAAEQFQTLYADMGMPRDGLEMKIVTPIRRTP